MVGISSLGRYLLAYLLWAITIALSLLCAMLGRTAYQYLFILAGWNRYSIRAFDNFALLAFGLVLVGVVVVAEHYYRTGVEVKRLFFRFSAFTLIETLILASLQLVLLIIQMINGSIDPIAVGLFGLMALVSWLLTRWRSMLMPA